jgi:phosphoribosylanthranilate isomerase
MKVTVKLCGFNKLEDINFAINAGIDYIGLNNIAISKRFVTADEIITLLEKLSLENRLKIVVLLNYFNFDFLVKLKELGVKFIQSYLANDEDKELFSMGFKLIKVFSIASKEDIIEVKNFDFTNYSYCLLDTKIEGSMGGTGQTFNWQLYSELDLSLTIKMILAGGLNAENVRQALSETKASFIDLAGGVEEKTGQKSYALIKELIEQLKG